MMPLRVIELHLKSFTIDGREGSDLTGISKMILQHLIVEDYLGKCSCHRLGRAPMIIGLQIRSKMI